MVSKELIEIIIKAQDQASAKANEVDKSLEKIGKTGNTATQSTQRFDEALLKANNSLGLVGNGAVQASNLLHQMKLDPNFGSTMDRAKLKVSQMGYDINSTKGKLMTFKTASIDTFNNFRQKVSSAGTTLKNKFSDSVKNAKMELQRLRQETKKTAEGFNYLKEGLFEIGANIATDLIYKLADAGKSSMESASKLDYFAGRLNMSSQKTQTFRKDLDELQQRFRKVDMTAVGASAEELSVKLGMGSDSLTEMSETLAVASSAFVAEGRTQEDAILAVSDAIDGQWAKLKELGITQEDIKNNGWNGDLNDKKSLLEGLNNTLEKMGFTKTAEDIVTLDDAIQALTVAGGVLIQKVLVPITPFLLQIMGGLLDMAYAIGNVIQYISDNGWIQFPLIITGVAIAFGLLAGAISVTEGGLMALVMGAMPSFIFSLYEAAAGFMAISVAGAPLWLIVGVIVAIAVAVYELGIYFGWWKDVGTMIDAITSGLTRMWNAFINHPDVQAFIQQLTDAWGEFVEWVGQAWQSLSDFFNLSEGGDFDIVHAIIINVGNAFNMLKQAIGFVVSIVQGVIYVFTTLYWIFDMVRQHIYLMILTFQEFLNGQMTLSETLAQLWSLISGMFTVVFNIILNRFGKFAVKLVTKAIAMGKQFVNSIITKIKQLPSKVYSVLLTVVSKIVSAIQTWITNAKSKAQGIVDGVRSVLSKTASAVSTALSGVKDAIVKPFQDAYNSAKKYWDDITTLGGTLPAGGEFLGAGGEETTTPTNKVSTTGVDPGVVTLEHNLTIDMSLDLQNVPPHINTKELSNALADKNVIRELVNNKDFQLLDNKAKERLNLKINRARGI